MKTRMMARCGAARVVAAFGLGCLAACDGTTAGQKPQAPPTARQVVVAVDLSGSLRKTERVAHRDLVSQLASTLSFGDRLVLVQAHASGIRDAAVENTFDMPASGDPLHPLTKEKRALEIAQEEAGIYVTSLFERPPVGGTDLFATLHTVADHLASAGGRKASVVILSDMLQCTPKLCMEGEGKVPSTAWVAEQKSAGLLPDLAGACVVVVGADATNPEGIQVRDFWLSYVEAAGGRLAPTRYIYQAADPARVHCA